MPLGGPATLNCPSVWKCVCAWCSVIDWHPIQDVFLRHAQCSCERLLQITADEGTNKLLSMVRTLCWPVNQICNGVVLVWFLVTNDNYRSCLYCFRKSLVYVGKYNNSIKDHLIFTNMYTPVDMITHDFDLIIVYIWIYSCSWATENRAMYCTLCASNIWEYLMCKIWKSRCRRMSRAPCPSLNRTLTLLFKVSGSWHRS